VQQERVLMDDKEEILKYLEMASERELLLVLKYLKGLLRLG
jgi:hypothetical protein